MSDAMPMVARCMERQWAGLFPEERARMTYLWGHGYCPLPYAHDPWPLWSVKRAGHVLTLIGVKEG